MSSLERLWAAWRREYIEQVTSPAEPEDGAECVLCAIVTRGDGHLVWRHPDDLAAAVLNAYPYTSGHLMVLPTRHVAEIEDLDAEEAAAVWKGMVEAVAAIKAAYRPDGLNLGANLGRPAGAGIPGHFHVHVLPRWRGDTNFMTTVADTRVLPEALSVSAEKLRSAWPGSGND